MNWRFCVGTREQRALKLCAGSMNEGDGYGDGDGNGNRLGEGSSPQEWR